MKKRVIIAAAACCFATPAFAEDGDWTGAYVGVSAGYNVSNSKSETTLSGNWSAETAGRRDFVIANSAAKQSVKDANYGVQAGFNAQIGESFVLGAEADFALLGGRNSYNRSVTYTPGAPTVPTIYTFENRIDPKMSYAVKGKLGIAIDKTLIYATGGWGWTRAEVGADISSNANYKKASKLNHTFNGYVVGGGIEHKFAQNISARIDYTYTDQGSTTYQTSYVTGSAFQSPAYGETIRQDLKMHQVRVGMNFHF